jgi:hypothetical protein
VWRPSRNRCGADKKRVFGVLLFSLRVCAAAERRLAWMSGENRRFEKARSKVSRVMGERQKGWATTWSAAGTNVQRMCCGALG